MSNIKFYLSSPPDFAAEAARRGAVSIMAYRIGQGFHLYRTVLPQIRFEIMDIDCLGFSGYGPHDILISEIVRECRALKYRGVVMSLVGRPQPRAASFCQALAKVLGAENIRLYLPEEYAHLCDTSMVLIPAQHLNGKFSDYLKDKCRQYGARRIALELERTYSDFTLPARGAQAMDISSKRFLELYGKGKSFYSRHLLTNYLSAVRSGKTHIVFWDDAASLRGKLNAARALGISEAFLYYPHIKDIINKINTGS